MLLRITKQLDDLTAKRILELKKNIKNIYEFLDPSFLYKDLNPPKESLKRNKNMANMGWGASDKTIFKKKIIFDPSPKYFTDITYDGILNRHKEKKSEYKKDRYLFLEKYKETSYKTKNSKIDISLSIRKSKNTHADFVFGGLGSFSALDKNNLPTPSNDSRIFFGLTQYFYNRKDQYKQTYELLVKNKKILKENLGIAFTKDLLSFFSIKINAKKIKNFYLPIKNLEKKIYFQTYSNQEDRELISYTSEDRSEKNIISSVNLSINKENVFFIDFILKDEYLKNKFPNLSEDELVKIKENKTINNFLKEEVAPWLKDLALFNAFQSKLLKRIQAKILINGL